MHLFKPEMIKLLKEELSEVLHYFGYTKSEGNDVGFIDYEGKAKEEHVK